MKCLIINQIKVSTAILILVSLSVVSCKKSFLEVEPKGKLIAEDVSDYGLLLNSNDLLNTGGANAQVFMGDEVGMAEPFFASAEPRTQRLFKWEPLVYEREEDAPETQVLLQQLYLYNKVINEVPGATGGTDQQKNSLVAEARAGRAWVYFHLINYFGKPYNAETSDADPGFPIITEADVTATTFTRASVKAVYDFMVGDLVAAITDLPVQTTHRMRMSKAAGEALLGKVYVFMGRFNEALDLFNQALADIDDAGISIELIDYNEAFADDGQFQPIDIFGPTTPFIYDDPETIYARQFSNFWILSSELVITPATVSLFGESDLRRNFYSDMPFPFGDPFPSGTMRRTGPITTSYGVILPDIILLRAECRARLNDLAGATEDLETLRRNRMPVEDAAVNGTISSNQQLLLQFILEERIREFASQGMRWFDMRRLSVDPVYNLPAVKHQVFNEDGSTQDINLPGERLTLKIPAKILAENPGMQDNP